MINAHLRVFSFYFSLPLFPFTLDFILFWFLKIISVYVWLHHSYILPPSSSPPPPRQLDLCVPSIRFAQLLRTLLIFHYAFDLLFYFSFFFCFNYFQLRVFSWFWILFSLIVRVSLLCSSLKTVWFVSFFSIFFQWSHLSFLFLFFILINWVWKRRGETLKKCGMAGPLEPKQNKTVIAVIWMKIRWWCCCCNNVGKGVWKDFFFLFFFCKKN